MTTNYQILTDSSCDLPASLARTLGVSYAPFVSSFRGRNTRIFWTATPEAAWR